jgi:hypothetical protein
MDDWLAFWHISFYSLPPIPVGKWMTGLLFGTFFISCLLFPLENGRLACFLAHFLSLVFYSR